MNCGVLEDRRKCFGVVQVQGTGTYSSFCPGPESSTWGYTCGPGPCTPLGHKTLTHYPPCNMSFFGIFTQPMEPMGSVKAF